jgi:AcrR family transcriptional regulator
VTDATAKRRGRPPRTESADTRDRILTAAREEFSERGYEKTSVRGIAKAAGVDPALVHHYFGTKEQVFEAAVEVAFAPAQNAPETVAEGPLDGVGERLTRFIFGIWENPATRTPLLAVVRSAVNNEAAAAVFRRLVVSQVLGRVAGRRGRAGGRAAGRYGDAALRDQGGTAGVGGRGADHRSGGAGGAGAFDGAVTPPSAGR